MTRKLLVLVLAWLVLTGDVAPANLGLGLLAASAAVWLSPRQEPPSPPRRSVPELVRSLPAVATLLAVFLWDMLRSSLELGREVLSPRPRLQPEVVAVPLRCSSALETTLLCGLVTLTPGSIALELEREEGRLVLLVHSVRAGDPARVRAELRALEVRVQRALRTGTDPRAERSTGSPR